MVDKNKKLPMFNRREALQKSSVLLGGIATIGLLAPVTRLLTFPLETATTQSPKGFLSAGLSGGFKVGAPKKVALAGTKRDAWATLENVEVGSVWVCKDSEEEFRVYSTICPHLGCAINHATDHFVCPCHGSHFELTGKRKKGTDGGQNPSPRDMDTLDWKVEDGVLLVKYARFKQGQETKEEVA